MSAEENSRVEAWQLAPPTETNAMDEPGHFIQFYEGDTFLLDTVAKFIGGSLEAGGGGVVIATRPHLDGIEKRLHAMRPTLVNCWSRCSETAEPTRPMQHRCARRWR